MFLANVEGTSQCVLPSPVCMVSSTVMPTLDHTTQAIFSHFWTDFTTFSYHQSVWMMQTIKETVCCSMGQRELSIVQPQSKTGLLTTQHFLCNPPTILTISEPHRRVLFGMAVEGIRPAALCAHASCAGHGRGMWWDWCGCNSGMDKALKALLPSMSGKGRYCLWCLTRRCGQTRLCGKMLPNYFSCLFFLL